MPISLTSSSTYTQNFDTLAVSGTSSILPEGWVFLETGTSTNSTYTAGTGSGNTGDTYSFGSTGSTERAFGILQSGSLVPTLGASFTNNTGSSITSLNIAYRGEQWRLGALSRADRIDFQYSTDATSLTTGTWTDVNTLDFLAPTISGTVGALDGNAAANRTSINSSISGLSIANGSTFWIRWSDFNASGSDDGLAIDDFSITPTVVTPTAGVTIIQSDNTTNVVEGGASNSYTVVLNTQPTADVTVAIANPGSPSQLALTPTTLTFTTANWNTPQLVSVTAVDDSLVEGLHASSISSTVTSTDSNYNGLSVAPLNVSIIDNDVTVAKIHDIQGSGSTFNTAFSGTQTIEGVVVGAFGGSNKLNGFYVQEEDADTDNDTNTSEGIFVFDPTGLFSGGVGSKVRVTGTVGEFNTASTSIAGTANSSLTQLSSVSSVVNLGTTFLSTVTATNVFLPVANASELERFEGMLVNVSSNSGPLTVTETFKLGRFGQVGLSGGSRIDQYTQTNTPSVSGYANYVSNLLDNYIILDDGSTAQNPDPTIHARGGQPLSAANTLRGGDTIASINGVLDQRFEGYRVQTLTPANFLPTNAREATAPEVGGTLRVASANLLNFFNGNGIDANNDGLIDGGFPTSRGADTAVEFKRQIDKTVQEVLGLNADVFGYNEIENDGYGSASAVQQLVNALNAATAPGTYAFVIPPASALNATGGFGGDEITVGFIYKANVVRIAPGTTAAALTTGIFDQVTTRVQRPAMAVTFERLANGTPTNETFTAVINHFKSKGSAANLPGDADQGDGQGLSNATRTLASQQLAAWLATNPTGTSDADYLIMGDLNSYRLEDPITTLTSAGYSSLFGPESYSYQFNGQWGSLDHALASASLNSQVTGAAKWHINSDEPIVLDYNTEFKTTNQVNSLYNVDAFRTSDHDPIIVGLNLTAPDTTPPAAPTVTLTNDTGISNSDLITQVGTLTLTNIEANALVEYSITSGTTWTNSFTAVQGANTVQVRQTDAAGNISLVTPLTFTLDSVAPTAPNVALTSDTGASNSDRITQVGTLAITGTEANAAVEYSIDGTTWTNSFTAAQGVNTVQVRQTDVAGNVSLVTPLTFTLDSVAPTEPNVALTSDTGASNSDRITQVGTLAITGTEANAAVEYSIDGTTWTNSFTADQGVNTVQVRQTDVAGNVSAPTTLAFTLDTSVAVPILFLALDSGISNSDKLTNSGIVNVSGLEPGASWRYSTDSGTNWLNGSGNSLNLTGNGVKNVVVQQTDLAGNISGISAPLTFTLDTIAPTKTVTIASMTKDTGTSISDFITNDGTAGRTYSGTLSAALIGASENLQVSSDGGITWNLGTVNNRSWTFVDSTAKSSNWSILARVADTAGNTSSIASRSVTLDQEIPDANSVSIDLTDARDSGVSSTDNLTNVARPTFAINFDSTKAKAGDVVQVLNSNNIVFASVTLTAAQVSAGTANVTLAASTPLSAGINTLSATYRDAAGNSVASASTLDVTYDNQISAASSITLDLLATRDSGASATDNITNVTLPTFAVTFDSAKTQAGDVIEVRRGSTVLGTTSLDATQASAGTVNLTLINALKNGVNNLSALHRDTAGNSVVGISPLFVTLDATDPNAPIATGYTLANVNGTAEANAILQFSTSASAPTSFVGSATATSGNFTLDTTGLVGSSTGTTYYLYAQDVAGNLGTASSQRVVVGTADSDLFANVGNSGSDLLIGNSGTDIAQYAVASNAISLTGKISSANGSVNIRTANIDVLTGIEQLNLTGTGYTGIGTGVNQLRSSIQSALGNNSVAEFNGVYESLSGNFSFGVGNPNATLLVFDSNPGAAQNHEAFLLLGKTTLSGSIGLDGSTVNLMNL